MVVPHTLGNCIHFINFSTLVTESLSVVCLCFMMILVQADYVQHFFPLFPFFDEQGVSQPSEVCSLDPTALAHLHSFCHAIKTKENIGNFPTYK